MQNVFFSQRLRVFTSDEVKINYKIGLLQGRALDWVQESSMHTHLNTLSLDEFIKCFEQTFYRLDHTGCASDRLLMLQQDPCSEAEYVTEFGTLAAELGWDMVALQGAFRWA